MTTAEASRLTGATARQIHYWTARGYLGNGLRKWYRRYWAAEHVARIAWLVAISRRYRTARTEMVQPQFPRPEAIVTDTAFRAQERYLVALEGAGAWFQCGSDAELVRAVSEAPGAALVISRPECLTRLLELG